jgi:hypothetical protein
MKFAGIRVVILGLNTPQVRPPQMISRRELPSNLDTGTTNKMHTGMGTLSATDFDKFYVGT